MKIGVIADVHNNITALEVVLHEFASQGVEGVICAGDIIGIGASPEETVTRLRTMDNLIACIKGNHESYLLDGMEDSNMDDYERRYHEWEHRLLSEESNHFLSSLSLTKTLKLEGKTIYVVHYALDGTHYSFIVKNPGASDLDDAFSYNDSDIIIYGHNHHPSYIKGDKTYINPGSLGCPGKDKNITRAGILTLDDDSSYQQLSLEYNVQNEIDKIEEYDFPAKEIIKSIFYGLR